MEFSGNWKDFQKVFESVPGVIFCCVFAFIIILIIQARSWQVATPDCIITGKSFNRPALKRISKKKPKVNKSKKRHHLGVTEPEPPRLTEVVAMDCEMVGIHNGKESMLARVSIVNSDGDTLYDTFVRPTEEVVDYRTDVSGVRPEDLENGVDFNTAQKRVATFIKGRILVGHALRNDLKVLFLSHPRRQIRDTSRFKPFVQKNHGKTPSLKLLAKEFLGIALQTGEHSSVEDAKAAMQLYNLYKSQWESGHVQ